MSSKDILKSATRALKVNKGRTALTMLGIVIGIMSIIFVMSLGQGAQNLILGQIQGMGAKVIEIAPGREPKGFNDVMQIFSDSLKEKDLIALKKKENVPYAINVEPLLFGSANAISQTDTYSVNIYGIGSGFIRIYDIEIDKGRALDDDDVKNLADVVVIGSKVKEELFGSSEAMGQKIKINSKNYRVIGILSEKGQVSMVNFDDVVLIPWTTAQQYIFGTKYFQHILVEAESEDLVNRTAEDIKITMRNSHNITDPEKDDFSVGTQASAMEQVKTITNIMTYFLAAVAAISLLVGGIGIMNIMLVSVTERTREIGLRKAVGAKNSDILTQFLFESVILTCLGGAIGIFLGIVLSVLSAITISYFLGQDWPTGISLLGIALGLGIAAFIGIVFGIYPARRASKLNPIEALRYE
ncbi:MAG: hypothetical protein A2Y98_00560 [Candidatus Portnoybacteria bacterium RBG_19FT_COMBO_36_7]|uniref:Multidrug ABC transporter substrate-binding protein n=1 Tax=Candidatus Portnoybacteria bacterium RBG_19FT_COMBO_36_7 TaxID=1801992 RepID=A0A1G2F856_9BACT|nr:MAG: hypothetical protein A2Y98_00560 [Candidatus Portnoybacteria bacterium RBG_19FT_COMBO_36_7]